MQPPAVSPCPDRRRVLQTLYARGRATGTALSRVLRLTDKTISRHLRDLHLLQLVVRRRESEHVWYQCDPARVHFARDEQGRDVLTLRHPSGAEVTRRVPATPPAPTAEPTGARTETGDAT
jgi:DNA-binding transcriptional ArsR family regulator